MKALKLEGRSVIEIEIENTLEALQAVVDGHIETIGIVPGEAVMIVNEEGRLHQLPPNIIASAIAGIKIVGPAIVVGVDGDEFTDIPSEVARHIKIRFGG